MAINFVDGLGFAVNGTFWAPTLQAVLGTGGKNWARGGIKFHHLSMWFLTIPPWNIKGLTSPCPKGTSLGHLRQRPSQHLLNIQVGIALGESQVERWDKVLLR